MSGIPYIVSEDCLACGACVDVCPEVFQLNESLGYAQVVHPDGLVHDRHHGAQRQHQPQRHVPAHLDRLEELPGDHVSASARGARGGGGSPNLPISPSMKASKMHNRFSMPAIPV